jgi:DNA polymerase-3 subunit alpha
MKVGNSKNIFDFCARVDLRVVNKRAIESLIQAGAFDSLKLWSQGSATSIG